VCIQCVYFIWTSYINLQDIFYFLFVSKRFFFFSFFVQELLFFDFILFQVMDTVKELDLEKYLGQWHEVCIYIFQSGN